jgi:cytochrome c oxidase cbb3-type subunit 2
MPGYDFLAKRELNAGDMTAHLKALSKVGVPYTEEDIKSANDDLKAQADPMADTASLAKRYPKMQTRDFDGNPGKLTEMDALVAYLQMLGTLVDLQSAAPQEVER